MARRAKRVIGVEVVPQAVDDARINAMENGIKNAEFICADAAVAAKRISERGEMPQVVVLDPPRKGCEDAADCRRGVQTSENCLCFLRPGNACKGCQQT